MRKLLLLSAFYLLSFNAFSEDNKSNLGYEIGVNLFSRNFNPNYQEPYFSNHYANGIMVRKHLKHFSARISFYRAFNEFEFDRENFNDRDYYYHYLIIDKGFALSKDLKIGVEKRLHKGKFQTYAGLDLMFQQRRLNGYREVAERGHWVYVEGFKESYNYTNYLYGFSASLGFRYQFAPNWAFTIEASYSFANDFGSKYFQKGISPVRMFAINYSF